MPNPDETLILPQFFNIEDYLALHPGLFEKLNQDLEQMMLIDIYGDSILEQGNKLLESVTSGDTAWIKLYTHFLLTVGDDPIGLLQIIQNVSKVISNER